jgi:hypothetical protein
MLYSEEDTYGDALQTSAEKEHANRAKSCLNKLTWSSNELAKAVISYSQWQYGNTQSKPTSYRCKYCCKYHLSGNYRTAE